MACFESPTGYDAMDMSLIIAKASAAKIQTSSEIPSSQNCAGMGRRRVYRMFCIKRYSTTQYQKEDDNFFSARDNEDSKKERKLRKKSNFFSKFYNKNFFFKEKDTL